MAAAPSSCAGTVANAPLKDPTAVRAALTITIVRHWVSSCRPTRRELRPPAGDDAAVLRRRSRL